MDFTASADCVAFITAELAPYGLTPPLDLEQRLEYTAGKGPAGAKVYRPYGVMSSLLGRAINQKHPISGKAGVLRDPDKAVAGWLQDQLEQDANMSLTPPPQPAAGRRSVGSLAVKTYTDWG